MNPELTTLINQIGEDRVLRVLKRHTRRKPDNARIKLDELRKTGIYPDCPELAEILPWLEDMQMVDRFGKPLRLQGLEAIRSKSRKQDIVNVRAVLANYLYCECRMKSVDIGIQLGLRDHSTISHNLGMFRDTIGTDKRLKFINNSLNEWLDSKNNLSDSQ